MAVDPQRFLALLDYSMFIVTCRGGEQRAGCLVGFASQVSIEPPRFLVCVSVANFTSCVATEARHLAVHLVARHDIGLAHLFGETTGDDVDKFARCRWRDGPYRTPILEEAAAWFVGEIIERVDFGDHRGYLLEPVALDTRTSDETDSRLVGFADVRDFHPGHDA
ncbi:flavin reductase family protein [Nocardia callitridis]|uniref:Flavin reductase family protein n=1 Tax=Nocardia callitridis TaxID=648753 RepID=A0ABP9KQU8_9NOCA